MIRATSNNSIPSIAQGGRGLPRYFLLTVAVFWIPVGILSALSWRRIDAADRRAFWKTVFLLTGLTTMMETIYMATKIWAFSEEMDPLLGPRINGMPVEEFSFWYGATPFMLLVYLTVRRWLGRKEAPHAAP